MRQSQLFTKTRKEVPADEVSKNAQLLIQGGFINKEMAGVYSFLPLGFKVLNNIKKIVAQEMEALGSQEIIMSTLQSKEIWEKTDRWSSEQVPIWFKTKLQNGNEVGMGWSHEEPITNMMADHITSYKDLPMYVHQFQNKLRNEERAKSGVMRCREFIMKDMYSYCVSEEQHMDFYNKTIDAYMNVYKRLGLGDITYVTSASGGLFTDKFSHEFQTLCEVGEDTIYVHKNEPVAVNEEIFNAESVAKLGYKLEDFEIKKAAEVGNIFTFGTKKCEQMGVSFMDESGKKQPVFLGSYGIGITRLIGVITEIFADDRGMVWPENIAPFKVHLIQLGKASDEATKLYETLQQRGIEVLLDDRDATAGAKFADADLIGIPWRVVVSDKSLAAGGYEVKKRSETEGKIMGQEDLLGLFL